MVIRMFQRLKEAEVLADIEDEHSLTKRNDRFEHKPQHPSDAPKHSVSHHEAQLGGRHEEHKMPRPEG